MAEAAVSLALHRAASMIAHESKLLFNAKGDFEALANDLQRMESALKQISGREEHEEKIQVSVAEARKLAYAAEDLIDSFVSEDATKPNILFRVPRIHRVAKEIKALQKRIEGTQILKLSNHGNYAGAGVGGLVGCPSVNEHVVGLEEDIESLVGKLTSNSGDNMVAIVGMGGSGKTTLAQEIYNHRSVQQHFEHQAWVNVSHDLDPQRVFVEILNDIVGKDLKDMEDCLDYQSLARKLKGILKEKRCLVVLDDVWEKQILESIIHFESYDLKCLGGSKIIVTTRNLDVLPSSIRSECLHNTHLLTHEQSLELFSKIVLGSSSRLPLPKKKRSNSSLLESAINEFKMLGEEMLKRCGGLPLAVVTLSKLLRTKDNMEDWERVASLIVEQEGTTELYKTVQDILALSYNDLTSDLRPLFLYFGLFPEDCEISVGMLVRMWIAEGFVIEEHCNEGETLDDAAKRRLQELINRSMVQTAKRNYAGQVKTVRIHDMMRDLCIAKAKEQDFLQLFSSDCEGSQQTPSRRAAINSTTCFNLPTESPRLRSLLLFGQPSVGVEHEFSANEDWARLSMTAVFERFKLLKLLDLVGIETSSGKLPKQIGDLVHLRYLRIRNTNIRRLPKSIARLNNLLTLDYWGVYVDTDIELPNVLWKLEQLRHLYLPYEMSTSMEDFKLHTLPNLQILWGVAGGNWMLKEMGKLSKTLQKLCIQGISSPGQLEAVFSLPSIKSNTLSSLLLDWYGFELPSLDPLHTTERLQKLRLKGRFRDKLAIRDQLKPFKFPASLVKLELYYTQIERQETMEALEKLPNLKFLRMSKDSYIGSQWSIQAGGFPQLVELKLFSLPNLEEWKMETGAIPLLRGLSIMSCLKLKGIPEGLKSIEQLEALEIERMPPAFCSRVRPEDSGSEGEDHHIIKHVPCVVISNPLATW